MEIIEINDNLLVALHTQAADAERKRMNYDLRTTAEDNSQRMLNALEVGTKVPIHRHLETSETTVCLQGCMDVVFYDLRPNEDCGGPVMGDCGTVIADGMEANVFEILFHFPLQLNTPFVPPQTLQHNCIPIVHLSQPPVL